MKNVLLKLVFISSLVLITLGSNAQSCPIDIGSGCVGECGTTDVITHYVPHLPPGQFEIYRYCLEITENSLCPNNNAYAKIYVNNNLVAGGLIGKNSLPTYQFWALDGSNIRVELSHSFDPNTIVFCKRLGLVVAELSGEL